MAVYMNGSMTAGYCDGAVDAVYYADEKVWPAADAAADWLYTSDMESVTLLLYTGSETFLTIPSRIDGLQVTALAPTACNYAAIKTVRIPAGVTILA